MPEDAAGEPAAQGDTRRECKRKERRGIVDLPSRADHDQDRERIDPVGDAHIERMNDARLDTGAGNGRGLGHAGGEAHFSRNRHGETRPFTRLGIDRPALVLMMDGPKKGEDRMSRLAFGIATLAFVAFTAPAFAQDQPVRVRGTIERAEGDHYIVKARNAGEEKVKLADNAMVVAIVKASLADVKQGSYVGVSGMPQPDGSQKCLEIR